MPMTDEEIAEGCKRQDNKARKALYERFAGSMMSLCLRYAGTREEAEDLLHDGFLKAFTAIGQFTYRGEGSLGAWLRRVFTNGALNYLETRKRLQLLPEEELPDDRPDDDEQPPDIGSETLAALIAGLPAGYRTVLNLYLVEGWSHREIAQRLGIGESTSASQYLRARAALRRKITEHINAH